MKLKKVKITRTKRWFQIMGLFNPWVLLASGEIKYVDPKDIKGKGLKVGDDFGDGILVGMKDVKAPKGLDIDGTKLTGSNFVRQLDSNPALRKTVSELVESGGKISKNELIKGLSRVAPDYLDDVVKAIKQFKNVEGIEKVVQDLSKGGGNFTIGATFALTFLQRNKGISNNVAKFEEAIQILGKLKREMDVALKGKMGWIEFKHWATLRKKSFLTQIVKDVKVGKKVTWVFSSGLGNAEEVKKMIKEVLNDHEYLAKMLSPEQINDIRKAYNSIINSVEVADFHISF